MNKLKYKGTPEFPLSTDNKHAFDHLFLSYYQALCFFAHRFVQDEATSQDIVETVFLKLLQNPQQFDSEAHIKAYTYRSVKNACLDHLKVNERINSRNMQFVIDQGEVAESYLQEIIRTEVIKELHEAIEQLPAQAGRIVTMSYLEGFSNKEIAEQLQLSIQTVKNQKARGLSLLRKKVGPDRVAILIVLAFTVSHIHHCL